MCVCFFWRFSGERRKPFQFQGASLDICASFDCSRLKVMDGERDKMFKQQLVIAKGNKGTSHSNVATLLLLHFSFLLGSTKNLAQANCTLNSILSKALYLMVKD